MKNSMLNNLIFDPAYILIGMGVLTVMLLIAVIICIVRTKKLYRKYDAFMRGKDAESLEERILEQIDEIKSLKLEDRANKDNMKGMNKRLQKSYQKMGLVKYDAFKGMGGQSSFALTLLDQMDNGIVMNAIHSREGCYLYLKRVDMGQTDVLLGNEEKEALEQALGYIEPKDN